MKFSRSLIFALTLAGMVTGWAATPTLKNFAPTDFTVDPHAPADEVIQVNLDPTQFTKNPHIKIVNVKGATGVIWTNDAGSVHIDEANSQLVATNVVFYGSFGTPWLSQDFFGPGEHCLIVANGNYRKLSASTEDPADTILNLATGYNGSRILLEKDTGANSFTIVAGGAVCDAGTGHVYINGDWTPTHPGESLIMHSDGTDWFEDNRRDPTLTTAPGAMNPTDNFTPYRINGTQFGDSYLLRDGANSSYFTNSSLAVDKKFVVNPRFQVSVDARFYGANTFGSVATIIDGDHVTAVNNFENRIISDAYNSKGFTAYGLGGTSDAENPFQWSPNIDWIGSGFSTNLNTVVEVGIGSQLHTFGAADNPYGVLAFLAHIGGVVSTNFSLHTASGWDGSGTHVFTDDGTFKSGSGVGTTINPTDKFMPYRFSATQFKDSPWVVLATNQMGFYENDVSKPFLQRWGGLTGDESWGIGESALGSGGSLIGYGNIALGKRVLQNIRAGTGNFGFGTAALQHITTGNNNLSGGHDSGNAITTEDANTFYGAYAWGARHGSNNISIGYLSNDALTDTVTNTITIGTFVTGASPYAGSRATNSGDIVIGNRFNQRVLFPGMTGDGTMFLANDGTMRTPSAGAGTTVVYDTQIVTNVTVEQNITIKGNASVTTITVGSGTITNSTSRAMVTSWSPLSAGTNYVVDLSLPVLQWNMTTNLNILHATNGTANFTTSFQKEGSIKVLNNSGTNFPVTLPSSWRPYGSATTNSFVATNGTSFMLAVQFAGTTTSQTNIDYALVYRSY